MTIKVTNYKSGDLLNISLPLLVGEVVVSGDSKLSVINKTSKSDSVFWPIINGKFKALVQLQHGRNDICLQHRSVSYNICLTYEPLQNKKFIRLVYIKCCDDEGFFQAPAEENNSVASACNRIGLGAKMLQTFSYDKFKDLNMQSKTFSLEESNGDVVCHTFTSSLCLSDAYALNDEQLWAHFAIELMNSNLRDGDNCKFLAFLSFTQYCNKENVVPQNHKEILEMTRGQVAMGGGGLALFGSGCLHTWAENIAEVPWRFGDKRKIDQLKFMDDSANRHFYWACYSTTLGAALHELGHTFDLGHTRKGIMGRGFDDIYKYYIVDMFYYDNLYQKEHNPYYQESASHNHTIVIKTTTENFVPSSNFGSDVKGKCNSEILFVQEKMIPSGDLLGEKPQRIPNPPDFPVNDPIFSLNVGGAYWTKSCALILFHHKWFNDYNSEEKSEISYDNFKISSPCGIQVVEFRDSQGMAFHHLEFPLKLGPKEIDLTLHNLQQHIPDEAKSILVVAVDNLGNVVKFNVNVSELIAVDS